jgi:hypothetical protein
LVFFEDQIRKRISDYESRQKQVDSKRYRSLLKDISQKPRPKVVQGELFMGLFTSYFLRMIDKFFLEIQFDCRGNSDILDIPSGLVITHHIAEAKASSNLQDGVQQLFIRLFLIASASRIVFGELEPNKNLHISSTGTLITLPTRDKDVAQAVNHVRQQVSHPDWKNIKIVKHVSGTPSQRGEEYA